MTGRELIQRIQELEAEDEKIYFQPKAGDAYKEVRNVNLELIGWVQEIIVITN